MALITTVLFDLDGTLTDPKVGITKSMVYALERLGQPAPLPDDLVWCIGPPLHKNFEKLLGGTERVSEGVAYYRERYADLGMYENELYSGIQGTLEHLKQSNLRLIVATSKYNVIATQVIAHFKLDIYFDAVYGSESDGTRGDKTELIAYLLARESLAPSSCLMIGDRKHDMIGAKNNGVRGIGAGWGYGSPEELLQAGAETVLRNPTSISAHILAERGAL